MSSSVNESSLEKKLVAVSNTQDSIQTLSLWLLHHRVHHKKIVEIWMKVLKQAKVSHRLTLFYLANDVVQNGKRKGYLQFGQAFAEVLREATLLVRHEKIRHSVDRVFNIWAQRNIYGSTFVIELKAILGEYTRDDKRRAALEFAREKYLINKQAKIIHDQSSKIDSDKKMYSQYTPHAIPAEAEEEVIRGNYKSPKITSSKMLSEFKPADVINKIRELVASEQETATKTSALNVGKLDDTNEEILQQLKDRTHGLKVSSDFEEQTNCMEETVEALEKEIHLRKQLITLLGQSEMYYDAQRGEAKVVANAYKSFSSKIKGVQKKVEEMKHTLRPVPEYAPSPVNSDKGKSSFEFAKPDDSNSLDNAPSPEGSPEGLALTPPNSEKAAQENSVGNPIPTLSNFFPQVTGMMSSWFDAFSSSSKNSTPVINSPTLDPKKADPDSLDSRLSNLMQNIPGLPSGLQSSLFGGSSSDGLTPRDASSPSPYGKDEATSAPNSNEVTTPVKDECSGQNTPLQDEDIHSSNHSEFFNPPSTSSKTSQNSKDVLKGLTNLIQTVTSATAEKPDYDPKQNISEFIKKIAPSLTHLSPHSSSSPVAFPNSPPNSFVSQPNENVHSSPSPSQNMSPNPHSFSKSPYSPTQIDPYSASTSSPSKTVHENLSFIPTLVPSTPHDGGFSFSGDEYNPETENYQSVSNSDDHCRSGSPPSTLLGEACESPDDLSDDEDIPKNISNQRQSTLITLVADDKTPTAVYGSPNSEDGISPPGEPVFIEPPCDMLQNANVIQKPVAIQNPVGDDAWPPVKVSVNKVEGLLQPQASVTEPVLVPPPVNFVKDHDERQSLYSPVVPPPVVEPVPVNGSYETTCTPQVSLETTLVSYPLSKIETIQSQRNDVDNRWFGNDWGGGFHGHRQNPFHTTEYRPHFNRRPFDQWDFPFRRGGPQSNFRPRNNWPPRERKFNEFEQGTPNAKRFTPFPVRGRGWKTNYYQQ